MATTIRTIIDDLLVDFKQQGDDRTIQRSQIAYWVVMVGNRLKMQHIEKRSSGQHLTVFGGIEIKKFDSLNNPNEIPDRKYIELPSSIFDYDNDGGIDYISYYTDDEDCSCPPPFTRQIFTRTTPSKARRLYMNRYEKPSPINPFFYRVGNIVYLLGIEKTIPKYVEMGIYTTLTPITDPNFDIDQPFDFPEELIVQLKRMVLDLARFTMVIPQERTNDGANETQMNQPYGKVVSVNDYQGQGEENQ